MRKINSKEQHRKTDISAALTIALIILIIIISAYLAISLSFSTNPAITPLTDYRPDTNDTLACSWTASGDVTQQNVSWHRNGESIKNETDLAQSTSNITQNYTARGDVWNCTVTMANGTDIITEMFNITIKNAQPSTPILLNNSAANVGNTTTVIEDATNSFTISSTDPDPGDTLRYFASGAPAASSLDENTGSFSWTPTHTDTDRNITFYATDDFSGTPIGIAGKKVLFIIEYVNDAPVFSPSLINKSINESQTFNYIITATDEENNFPLNFSITTNPSLSLTITNTSNTTALIMFEGNRSASYSEAGNYTINVTVIDNNGSESKNTTSTFVLRINQTDVAPVLRAIPNYTGTQGSQFNFTVYADDPDEGDTLNFTITPTVCSISGLWSINTTNTTRNATGLVNVSALTNDHVVCRQVRITVIDDAGAEDSQDVFLNISNLNDPPIVEVLSSSLNNTASQQNISDLYAYAESQFMYQVNATDIDMQTYENDTLTYSDNTSLFTINPSTGLINFTPNQSIVGNHSINISVTDLGLLVDWAIMNLEIRNNSAPVLSQIGNISCAEDMLCLIAITATDADNDNLNFSSNNTLVFNATNNASQNPMWSALVNFTPNQSLVANYSITVSVRDIRNASTSESFVFSINNTNDAPVLGNISLPTLVAGHLVIIDVFADDDDYDLTDSTENLTFSDANLSGRDLFDIITATNNDTNRTFGRIILDPLLGDAGNYSFNISVMDAAGLTDWTILNFTILAKSNPPNITNITPYMANSSSLSSSFISTTNFTPDNYNNINFSENRSVLYNITVTDDLTATANLTYAWYINSTLNSTSSYLNIAYNFFSSGGYNISVVVSDDMYENSSWSWLATIADVNRAPLLINNLENLTVNRTETYSNYLKNSPVTHFLDPDDDLNSSNSFEATETSLLTYTATTCNVATLSISGHSLTITPLEVGYCLVAFTAEDTGGLTNTSNTIKINVTLVPNDTEEVETPTPSTGGGGGGRSTSVITPTKKEELKPKSIELVVPDIVTIYENQTVVVPITLQNNWNTSLKKITLNASTTTGGVEFEFDKNYFEELVKGQKVNVSLFVKNYRLGEDFKIKITANVSDPETSDSAIVLLNSIEQSEVGQNVETKVTFAQDLLNENPECLELNELLEKAKEALQSGSKQEAARMVDGVIEGCKYLVSISKKAEQNPDTIMQKVVKRENMKYTLPFIGIALILTITMVSVRKKTKKLDLKKKEQEKKRLTENKFTPYQPDQKP